ncbi:MAG TPA: hypothetical protein VH206_01350 [Xanthobacteraceae bacterium]|jgi:hypothetical protein|nr:hypothetical protein [Xanthobacteraceae bacterium]
MWPVVQSLLTPKVLGPILTACGSLLLAWRVKTILEEIFLAVRGHDTNFRSVGDFLANKARDLPILTGFDERVARQFNRGKLLLVVGLLLIAAGALLNAYGNWLTH